MNLKVLDKKFYLLMFGKFTSLLGSDMQQFSLSLYVLARTGSATIFASLLAIAILPRLILSPIAGVCGDWFDRKKTIVILDFVNVILIGGAWFICTMTGELPLWIVYVIVVLLEIVEVFFGSAMTAVVPSIVEKDKLAEANSVKSLVTSIGIVLAPLIAGSLYGFWGIEFILMFNAISFFISAVCEMFIKIPKSHKSPEKISVKAFIDDFNAGVNVIKDNKAIRSIIGLGTFLNLSFSPLFSIGILYIMKEILKCTDLQFGIYQFIAATGMLMAPLLMGVVLKRYKVCKAFIVGSEINALIVLPLAILPTALMINLIGNLGVMVLITIVAFLIILVVTITNILLGTMFDEIVPLEYMGRTGTVFNMVVTISIPIGNIFFGLLYDYVPVYISVLLSCIIALIAVNVFKKPLLDAEDNEFSCKDELDKELSV